jgi:hypothetical protein
MPKNLPQSLVEKWVSPWNLNPKPFGFMGDVVGVEIYGAWSSSTMATLWATLAFWMNFQKSNANSPKKKYQFVIFCIKFYPFIRQLHSLLILIIFIPEWNWWKQAAPKPEKWQ